MYCTHDDDIRRLVLGRAPRHRRVALELLEATTLLGVEVTKLEVDQCYERACKELGIEPNDIDKARLVDDLKQLGYDQTRKVKSDEKVVAQEG